MEHTYMPNASKNRKHIVIVGNSGFARECHIMLRQMMLADPALDFRGFLSFEDYEADLKDLAPLFLGNDDDYAFTPEEPVVIGIGDPDLRKKAHEKLMARGCSFFTLVHPTSYIDASASLGEGNIFGSRCHVTSNCAIGNANVFNGLVHIGHDAVIGDYNFVAPNVQILGDVRMGDLNTIGATCVLLPHCRIGCGNILAPLSAMYKGCGDFTYMSGNPAIRMGTRDPRP